MKRGGRPPLRLRCRAIVLGSALLLVGTLASGARAGTANTVDSATDATCRANEPSDSFSFPSTIAADGRHVLDGSGNPWLVVGDAGWSAIAELDRDEFDWYLDQLASMRFNAVLVSLIETSYSSHPPANHDGEVPFVGDLFQSRPNETYWELVDEYVAAAAARGITLLATPAYLGYATDGVAAAVAAATQRQMFDYGTFLGRRYADSPNIMWVVGGDRTDLSDAELAGMDAMAQGIRSVAPQLIAGHAAGGSTAADVYGEFDWLQVNTSYESEGDPAVAARRAVAQQPTRPTFSIEGVYEQERDDALPSGNALLRYQAYGAILSGGFGHVFGNNPRWHFGASNPYPYEGTWELSLEDPRGQLDRGTSHQCVVAKIVGGLPWANLQPDVDGLFVVGADGPEAAGVAAAFSTADSVGAVYVPSSDAGTVTVEVSALGTNSDIMIVRVDPTNGSVSDMARLPAASGEQPLPPPGTNANGDTDWLYIMSPAPTP
ncbi:DUF4038 domain-containing protein [Desertimonas flava]|uniref:apiosidase-like domain-containing protein n=1 Tax=Desertimonas flava TaxID=2064846 RepID=UPI000E34BEAB|nr:DUF4038 domain-containing protein [Desertimonas flava]